MSICQIRKKYGFRAWPLYEKWGGGLQGSARTPRLAPFPRAQRWREPFVRVEDTKVERIKLNH